MRDTEITQPSQRYHRASLIEPATAATYTSWRRSTRYAKPTRSIWGERVANLRSDRSDAPGAFTEAAARRLRRTQRERDPAGGLIRPMRLSKL
jgi:hypothetical protein